MHTEPKEQTVYALTANRTALKLKESTAAPNEQPRLINRIFPNRVVLPARNATMAQFTAMMGRAVLDRVVVDKTGLSRRYDFDLEWTPDDTQFGGALPPIPLENIQKPDLFAALQQLGLKLESTRAEVDMVVIDSVERPTPN